MRALLLASLVACGSSTTTTTSTTTTESSGASLSTEDVHAAARAAAVLPAETAPLVWLVGDWKFDGGTMHWFANGNALFGIALKDGDTGFDVLMIQNTDKLELFAQLGGQMQDTYRTESATAEDAVFANLAARGPKRIAMHLERGKVHVAFDGKFVMDLTPIAHERATVLEDADRAFNKDTAGANADALLGHFAADGWVLDRGLSPAKGDALRKEWTRRLDGGSLTWEPVDSSALGDIGVTVGNGLFHVDASGVESKSAYLTVWRKGSDAEWHVLYDTGRPVRE